MAIDDRTFDRAFRQYARRLIEAYEAERAKAEPQPPRPRPIRDQIEDVLVEVAATTIGSGQAVTRILDLLAAPTPGVVEASMAVFWKWDAFRQWFTSQDNGYGRKLARADLPPEPFEQAWRASVEAIRNGK